MASVYVHTNAEVIDFLNTHKNYIFTACRNQGLNRNDWKSVLYKVADMYGLGQIEFDPAREAKMSTFVYRVAACRAIDEIRAQHPERFPEQEDPDWEENLPGKHNPAANLELEDEKLVTVEALRRLYKECRDKKKVAILFYLVLGRQDRETIASHFNVKKDYVSLVKNRWLKRLEEHVKQVLKEDEDGTLKLGAFSLQDLCK